MTKMHDINNNKVNTKVCNVTGCNSIINKLTNLCIFATPSPYNIFCTKSTNEL